MSNTNDLTLFYFPRACSLAAHIALEESGLDYDRRIIDLRTQKNLDPEYLAFNSSGAVPALRIGHQTLTETQAILTYVGDLVPNGELLPAPDDFLRYRAHEWMNFMSSSVHTYIRSIFRSSVYAGNVSDSHRAPIIVGDVILLEPRFRHYALRIRHQWFSRFRHHSAPARCRNLIG